MNLKDKKIIVGSYILWLIILCILKLFQNDIIILCGLLLVIIQTAIIYITFLKEIRIIDNKFSDFLSGKEYLKAIEYLTGINRKKIYGGSQIFVDSLLIYTYILAGEYENAQKAAEKIKWNKISYTRMGYYSILLDLYYGEIERARLKNKELQKIRNKYIDEQKIISSELIKMAEQREYDKGIINQAQLDLVLLIVEKYEKKENSQ